MSEGHPFTMSLEALFQSGSMKRAAALFGDVVMLFACALSMVVPALPWISGAAQYAIMIALFAVAVGANRLAAEKGRQSQTDSERLITRNRKYWDEFDHLAPDPLFRSGIEVWVPPSLASDRGSKGSRYFATVP
jgi:hypothetical protein